MLFTNTGQGCGDAPRWVLLLLLLTGGALLTHPNRAAEPVEMRQLLAEISAEALQQNPYLGQGRVAELRAEHDGLPDGPSQRRWALDIELAREELRLGNNETAIELYLEAYTMMGQLGEAVPADEAHVTTFELALAYMRQAENLNCALNHTSESCILPIRGGGVHRLPESSRAAARYLTEVVQRAPRDSLLFLRARWLLNITSMTLGLYPDGIPEPYRIAPRVFESDEPFPRFSDVAPQLGLNSFDLAGGAIVEDFDGDGLLDVLVSTNDPSGAMHYYRNTGDGHFAERTEAAGLVGFVGGLNMTSADYDNDGDADVLVLRGGWWRADGRHPNSLLRNDGHGHFHDVTFEAGLGEQHYPTQTAAWADYDNDGRLDLYIGNEHDQDSPAPSQLFHNEGDGTFRDVTRRAGVANLRYTKGVAWGDYDGDRFPDLYVSNMGGLNRLYRNNGDGTFTDVAGKLGVTRPVAGFASWFWDYDNDGVLDLFVASYGGVNLPPDVAMVAASFEGRPHGAELDHLYHGDGQGGFQEVSRQQNLVRATLPMGANFGDLDNDGWLDFYLGTGYPQYEALMPNVMYRNRGDGRGFADVTTNGGFGHLQKGHGVVFADLDNDGDQDVFEQLGGQYPGDGFGNVLFENPGFDNHWIKLVFVGTRSNRAGIGVRVRIDILEDGRPRSIYRTVGGTGSFGVNPRRLEIGLGRAERIERLEVYWPSSGRRQQFDGVAVGQLLEIREDADTPRTLPLPVIVLAR